jgi:hypothetical protein
VDKPKDETKDRLIIDNMHVHFDVASGSDKEVFARLFEEHISAWQRMAAEGQRRRCISERDRQFGDRDREEDA